MFEVIKELKEYKGNVIKLNSKKLELKNKEYILQSDLEFVEDDEETIEGMNSRNIDYMRQGHGIGLISNKTEGIAIAYRDCKRQKINRTCIIRDIAKLKSEIFTLEIKKDFVENVILDGMSDEEKYLIDMKYFRRCSWDVIKYSFEKQFGKIREISTLKENRQKAIERIEITLGERKEKVEVKQS